jgi:AraC-like DNA-binding protein
MQHSTATAGTTPEWPIDETDATVDQRVGPFSALPAHLRQLGVDPAAVLADCCLPPEALDRPDGRMPFAATSALLDAATRHTGRDDFALQFGLTLRLDHAGAVGELARYAATLGDALRAAAVHQCLYSRGALTFLIDDGASACFGYSVYRAPTVGAQLLQDAVAGMILNGIRDIIGGDWLPDRVLLARRRPASVAAYRRAFGIPVVFDAEFSGVHFPAQALHKRPHAADPRRFEMLQAQIAVAGQRELLDDLRRALRVEMLHGQAHGDRVARVLDMHRRTLNRRLRDLGVTFQRVLDEVRFDTARHFLQLTAMPLPQIACALGYTEETSFARAFRRWSGLSPGRFRIRPPAP